MKFFSSPYIFPLVVFVQLCLWFIVKDDPFFGDSIASTSKAALAIYDSGFHSIFYPQDVDPGHPTLYPMLMALCWLITGPQLWISHLLSTLCVIFMLWCLRKVMLLYVSFPIANLVVVLSGCFATCISMNAMMLNTTLLMAFCLLAIYALLTERPQFFMIVASVMMLIHLQAAYFLVSLLVADAWIALVQEKINPGRWIRLVWIKYTCPVIIFSGWLLAHYHHTGWVLHSPNYSDSQSLKGIGSIVKSSMLIVWRLIDYGMLPVHCITFIAILKNGIDRKLAALFVCMLAVTCLIMVLTLEHTIGHRYFLVFQLLSTGIAVIYLLQLQLKYFVLSLGFMFCSLIAGNFLFYPGKTIGDATLAYRSYFNIEEKLRDEHPHDTLFSFAPIANSPRSKYLDGGGLLIQRITSDSFNNYPVILQSNVNAEFTARQKAYLEQNWYGKSYEQGAVYVSVFLNPARHKKPEGWKLRTPSWIEQRITRFKNAAKN